MQRALSSSGRVLCPSLTLSPFSFLLFSSPLFLLFIPGVIHCPRVSSPQVRRARDGRSYQTRFVEAHQTAASDVARNEHDSRSCATLSMSTASLRRNAPIFLAVVSFHHSDERSLISHQLCAPQAVRPPETLPNETQRGEALLRDPRLTEPQKAYVRHRLRGAFSYISVRLLLPPPSPFNCLVVPCVFPRTAFSVC